MEKFPNDFSLCISTACGTKGITGPIIIKSGSITSSMMLPISILYAVDNDQFYRLKNWARRPWIFPLIPNRHSMLEYGKKGPFIKLNLNNIFTNIAC